MALVAGVVHALSVGDPGTRATLANAVGGTSKAAAVTIMLDQSMPTSDGAKTRLGNVTTALMDRLKAMSPNSSVGLWTFDGVSGRNEIPAAPLSDQAHASQLISNLNNQSSSGGGHVSFTTLRMLYGDAMSKYVDGQANSILLITSGPHTDQSLDGQGLQDYIKSAFDPARPVAVNVIVLIQLFYLLNCRSLTRTIFSIGFLSNRWLLAGIGLMLTMQLLFTYAPPLQSIFRTSGIGLLQWGVALAAGLVAFLVVEAEKHLGKAGEKP